MLTLDEAIERIRATTVLASETIRLPVVEADGLVLAQNIVTPIDVPSFDNAAVDGFAVRYRDFQDAPGQGPVRVSVRGRLPAGSPNETDEFFCGSTIGAFRIFTGAPMPAGFDTVVAQEQVTSTEDGQVLIPKLQIKGANCRLAGEDLKRGSIVLASGERLHPGRIALLAGLGIRQVSVRRPLRVAILSTGSELVPDGRALEPGEIYDVNRAMLTTLLIRRRCVVTDLGIIPDKIELITEALIQAAKEHDLIVTTAGMSVGEEDHVRNAVEHAADEPLTFWRVAVKPGRPAATGRIGKCAFLGLPGNPSAAFVIFTQLGQHLIAGLQGELLSLPKRPLVRSGFALKRKPGLRAFLKVQLGYEPSSEHPVATILPTTAAIGGLASFDGFIDIPSETTAIEKGQLLRFVSLSEAV